MEQQNTAHFTSLEPNFLGEVKTPNHAYFVDEPAEQGGQGEYPQPRNYLLGALSACIGTTLRMYTQHKGWEVGKIEVGVELTEELLDGKKHFSIQKNISYENNDLSEEQISRLLRVADKCPLSQILAYPVEMNTKVVSIP
ncbi:MAG: OsmC family protein [Bacteroidota bacterium]